MNRVSAIIAVGSEPAPLVAVQREDNVKTIPVNKSAKPGRFRDFNGFADFSMRDLDRAEIAVWMLLFRDTKQDGIAHTSQADLAKRAGVNVRTVGRAVSSLHKVGLIEIVSRGGVNRGASSYRVHPFIRSRTEGTDVR